MQKTKWKVKKYHIKTRKHGEHSWKILANVTIYANTWAEAKREFTKLIWGWFVDEDNIDATDGVLTLACARHIDDTPIEILRLDDPVDTFEYDSRAYTIRRVD